MKCDHYWIPKKGANGLEDFRPFNGVLAVYATCPKCGDRTWFTKEQWANIPVVSAP